MTARISGAGSTLWPPAFPQPANSGLRKCVPAESAGSDFTCGFRAAEMCSGIRKLACMGPRGGLTRRAGLTREERSRGVRRGEEGARMERKGRGAGGRGRGRSCCRRARPLVAAPTTTGSSSAWRRSSTRRASRSGPLGADSGTQAPQGTPPRGLRLRGLAGRQWQRALPLLGWRSGRTKEVRVVASGGQAS